MPGFGLFCRGLISVRSVVRVYPGPFCGIPCPTWLLGYVGLSVSCCLPPLVSIRWCQRGLIRPLNGSPRPPARPRLLLRRRHQGVSCPGSRDDLLVRCRHGPELRTPHSCPLLCVEPHAPEPLFPGSPIGSRERLQQLGFSPSEPDLKRLPGCRHRWVPGRRENRSCDATGEGFPKNVLRFSGEKWSDRVQFQYSISSVSRMRHLDRE